MGLYPEAKASALDLLRKQSTIDQDLQNPNNQLKFSIASLLFNDQLPGSKKQMAFDQYQRTAKYDHHHSENNDCLNCFKSWFHWCSYQKQHKVKELNALASVNKLAAEPSIVNPHLGHQLSSQVHQQLNHQLSQQMNSQLNQQLMPQLPNRPSITNQQISSSSIQLSIQSQLQGPIQSSHQTHSLNTSSLHLNSNKHHKNSTFNPTSVQQITNYLSTLNSNQGNSAGDKIAHQSIGSKKKRIRTIFTPEQLERLELEFERKQYMVGPERLNLAAELKLSEVQVKVYFQNRRIKYRREREKIKK